MAAMIRNSRPNVVWLVHPRVWNPPAICSAPSPSEQADPNRVARIAIVDRLAERPFCGPLPEQRDERGADELAVPEGGVCDR